MKAFGSLYLAAFAALLCVFDAAPASAQVSRTWVASTGTDTGLCTRAAPCRSLLFAMTRTTAGGQISCVDAASFGPIIILKSLTIECEASPGGIIVDSGNAVTIAAADTDVVHIRGLEIAGMPASCCGIRVVSAGEVHLENVVVRNFAGDYGVVVEPQDTATQVFMNNVTLTNNGTNGIGGGILIFPTGTGTANVVVTGAIIQGNNGAGIRFKASSTTGQGSFLAIRDSQVSGNTYGVTATTAPSSGAAVVNVQNSAVVRNTIYGIAASGPVSQIIVSGSAVTANGTGLVPAGGSLISLGDNVVLGNTTDGVFTATTSKK